jgi:hypothetical protein
MKIGDPDWLTERQHQYMKLMSGDAKLLDPASTDMMDLHKKVTQLIDSLPVSSGGYQE